MDEEFGRNECGGGFRAHVQVKSIRAIDVQFHRPLKDNISLIDKLEDELGVPDLLGEEGECSRNVLVLDHFPHIDALPLSPGNVAQGQVVGLDGLTIRPYQAIVGEHSLFARGFSTLRDECPKPGIFIRDSIRGREDEGIREGFVHGHGIRGPFHEELVLLVEEGLSREAESIRAHDRLAVEIRFLVCLGVLSFVPRSPGGGSQYNIHGIPEPFPILDSPCAIMKREGIQHPCVRIRSDGDAEFVYAGGGIIPLGIDPFGLSIRKVLLVCIVSFFGLVARSLDDAGVGNLYG